MATYERGALKPITPVKQAHEASCVPTALSMVLEGIGVDIEPEALIDRYFPFAKLKGGDPEAGVTNTRLTLGILEIFRDESLTEKLQADLFLPHLWDLTHSSSSEWIVRTGSPALNRFARRFKDNPDIAEFYQTIGRLVDHQNMEAYTVNGRLFKTVQKNNSWYGIPESRLPVYDELGNFLRLGHSIGSHGGLTRHVWAVDGERSKMDKCLILDPSDGKSHFSRYSSLIRVDTFTGVTGDMFDTIFRISPRQEPVSPPKFDLSRSVQNLKNRFGN